MSIAEKLTEIAENVQKVFDAGKKAENKEFWDEYQDRGNRQNYNHAFTGLGWSEKNLKPCYDIKPQNAVLMFRDFPLAINIQDYFESVGVDLDFSKCVHFTEMCLNSAITAFNVIDTTSAPTSIAYIFSSAKNLKSVGLLRIRNEGSQAFNSAFNNANSLEDITIEGVIGKDVDFKSCVKLSKASITSIINALSTTTSGPSITFSKTAVNKVFETSEGVNNGSTSTEWANLIATKSNWTISLA